MDFLRFTLRYVYTRRKTLAYVLLCCAVCVIVFLVRKLPLGTLGALIAVILAPASFLEARRLLYVYQKHLTLSELEEVTESTVDALEKEYPPANSLDDGDYQALLRLCLEGDGEDEAASVPDDAPNYYARWAREIKAPITAMEQLLLAGDSPLVRGMSVELRRLERYAEMAVVYARLETNPDYAPRLYDLNALIQRSLQKYNAEILEKRLSVTFEPTPCVVETDGKWFVFLLDQLLSNALKYTYAGGVTIALERTPGTSAAWEGLDGCRTVSDGQASGDGPFLLIRDTGGGIDAETMGRLFEAAPAPDAERGGLGLYLCRRICAGLGHAIAISSKEGEGTCVRLELSDKQAAPVAPDNETDDDAYDDEITL